MAKKKKKAPKKAAAAAPAGSPCDQGDEMLPLPLRVAASDVLTFSFFLCKTAGLLFVDVDAKRVAEGKVVDRLDVTLPGMKPGTHSVVWTWMPATEPWRSKTEIAAADAVKFRLKKASDSSFPVPRGFAILEVMP